MFYSGQRKRCACPKSDARDQGSGYQRADEEVFNGMLASASARPQRSEESQGDGCPRPAFEGPEMGRGAVLRMRRILRKMTTFDDFLTTNDDFRRWSLPGRNGFSEAVLFYFKGLSIVAATKRRVIDYAMNSTA
jgi:hypothetical protein